MKQLVMTSLALLALTATPALAADNEAANRQLAKGFVEDIFNKHSVAAADKYVAKDAVDHTAMPGDKPGITGFKNMAGDMFKAFPDLHVTIEGIIVDGDKVAILNTMHGTSKGAYMGMPPTGRHFSVQWIDWMTVKNGKIADHWGFGDTDGMMKALAPAPKKPVAKPMVKPQGGKQ